ncbi:MAG: magnesium transporter CorA family protein [Nocardioidaceae bacterium]
MSRLDEQERMADGGRPAPDNVFLGLGDDHVSRIEALRKRGDFLWLDLDLDSEGTQGLEELLQVPQEALEALGDFHETSSIFRRSYADDVQVVFPFICCVPDTQGSRDDADEMRPLEVHVLVRGDCIVTVHHGPCDPLTALATDRRRVAGSVQRLVYAVLAAMVASIFESVAHLEAQRRELEDDFDEPPTGRRTLTVIKHGRKQLNRLRGPAGPQLAVFEQIADVAPDLTGSTGKDDHVFDKTRNQLSHAISSIDAADDALAGLLDLHLGRTNFLLTLVAMIFLPLTFITGFFGQNFDWFLSQITSAGSFWLLGIGSLLLTLLGQLWLIRRMFGRPGAH